MEYRKTILLKDGSICTLRSGTEADARAVLENFLLTHGQTEYLATYRDEITLTPEQERAYLKNRREDPRQAALVAEVDGRIVGTAGIDSLGSAEKTRHRASFGISVDASRWGLGVGRGLTEACVACAAAAGYTQLELEVVSENTRALRLYESAGFAEYGRNPRAFRTRSGRWQETVLMRLELAGAAPDPTD